MNIKWIVKKFYTLFNHWFRFFLQAAVVGALLWSPARLSASEVGNEQRKRQLFNKTHQENEVKDDSLFLAIEVIGLTLAPTSGLRGGVFLDPKNIVEISLVRSSPTWSFPQETKYLIEAQYKHFLTSSFYVGGGLAAEYWDFHYYVKRASQTTSLPNANGLQTIFSWKTKADDEEDLTGTMTNLGAVVHVGNQWRIKKFTLGCDWVGAFLAVSTQAKFSGRNDVDPLSKEEEENAALQSYGGSSLHILRFYIGLVF